MKFRAIGRRRLFAVQDLGISWAESHTQAPNALVMGDVVRVYFSTRQKDGQSWTSRIAFADLDADKNFHIIGVSRNPALDLGELGAFDMFGAYPASVIQDAEGFLMAYGGWCRPTDVPFDVAVGLARSNDGIKFDRIGQGPVLGKTAREPYVLSSPKIRKFAGKYFLFYIAGVKWVNGVEKPEPVYKIRMAMSVDGASWVRMERDLIEDKIPFESQASPDVFYYGGQYHMVFSFRGPSDYLVGPNSYRFGYARSDDLMVWERQDSSFPFPLGEKGWDSEMVAYPNVFFANSCPYLLYTGNGVGKTGIGIAELEIEN
jgi:hypothetical protein